MRKVTHKLGRVSVQAGLLVLVGVLVANSSQVAPEIENNNNAKSIAYNMVPLFGTIMVQGEPAEGGIVSGTGTFPSGVMTIIKAQANEGWEFVRWQDGNVQAQRTVPVVSWTTYYTAYFKKSSDLECCGGGSN